jgi:hypothetical protein
MENHRVRAGRKEVERFAGRLLGFGEKSCFRRRVRRTGPITLGAALLGASLLLLTACGGGSGNGGSEALWHR